MNHFVHLQRDPGSVPLINPLIAIYKTTEEVNTQHDPSDGAPRRPQGQLRSTASKICTCNRSKTGSTRRSNWLTDHEQQIHTQSLQKAVVGLRNSVPAEPCKRVFDSRASLSDNTDSMDALSECILVVNNLQAEF